MRTVRRLRLRCLLFTTTPVVLSVLLLIALSNLVTPIKKHTLDTSTQRYLLSGLNLHPCGV